MAAADRTEQSMEVVRGYCEHGIPALLKGNPGAVHEYLADQYVQHVSSHVKHGKHNVDDQKMAMLEAQKAIPDLRYSVDRYVGDGDYVATHWRIEGTHAGRHRHRHSDTHLEGSGEDALIQGMTLYHVEQGKITESWMYDTHLDFLIGVGALELHDRHK